MVEQNVFQIGMAPCLVPQTGIYFKVCFGQDLP